MTYCPNTPYIQTLTEKFSNYTSLSITKSITPGQSRCSFSVTNVGDEHDVSITVPTIVSVHDAQNNKLFAGVARSKSVQEKGDGSEVINVDFPSFDDMFFRMNVIRGYQSAFPTKVETHAQNILIFGGAYDPNLNFNLVGSDGFGTGNNFHFEADGIYANEALNNLCGVAGKRWSTDYGAWENIDTLIAIAQSGGFICNLILSDSTLITADAPFPITLPFSSLICGDQSKYFDVSWSVNFSDVVSRVIVVGKGGDLASGNVGVQSISESHDILPASVAKHFPLNPFCIVVTEVEITN